MIISKTPFRVSFCGGGSDLADFYKRGYGAVVTSAIDKFVYLAIHRFFEPRHVLKYSQTETAETVDMIKHPLIRECLRFAGTKEFLEITSFADIPSTGSGLGSSSAFSVGLINALLSMQGRMPSHETCAAGVRTALIGAAAAGGADYVGPDARFDSLKAFAEAVTERGVFR